MITRKKSNR